MELGLPEGDSNGLSEGWLLGEEDGDSLGRLLGLSEG
jgi:hypothetical protein